MNTTYVTHPSVRIKGTENYYNPVQCFEQLCPDKLPHMHCPFCVKTDVYTDPVILKAHYRVKHVDKGIDFAGLKVLRCCDQCDIVGVIKGEKKFKGAHWHCYKCRNGFNRRDEAVKHYKTHFRNPQTTFQIQIAQEVNTGNSEDQEMEQENATATISGEDVSGIHPALSEAVTSLVSSEDQMFQHTNTISMPAGKMDSGLHMPVAAIETVELNDTQTIMIIQDDGVTSLSQDIEIDTSSGNLHESLSPTSDRNEALEQRIQQLEMENSEYQKEIQRLKSQLKDQTDQLALYRQREQDLLNELSIPLDKGLQGLLQQLETQHRDLLHQQLACLKRSYITTNNPPIQPVQRRIVPVPLVNATTGANTGVDVHTDESDSIIEVTVDQDEMMKYYDNENHNSSLEIDSSTDNVTIAMAASGSKSTIQESVNRPTDKEIHFVMINPNYSETGDDPGLTIEESIPIENDGALSATLDNEDGPPPVKVRRQK